MGIREEVAERFPSLIALLNQPEIGGLLTRAVQESWSPGKFQSEFIASNWFRGQSETQRRWWVMSATDPGEASQQRSRYGSALSQSAQRMGVSLSGNLIKWLTEVGLQRGWEVDSPEMRDQLAKQWGGKDQRKGQVGVDAQQIRALAEGEYFEPMSGKRAYSLALDIARGNRTMEEYQMRFQARAADRFPHLKQRIVNGETLAQIVEPYRNIVADELEMGDPGAVNMKDPLWRQLLGIKDGEKMRMLTESEVMTLARSQPRWWGTANGRAADHGMTRTLLKTFGQRSI